jgi:hypothetical protein
MRELPSLYSFLVAKTLVQDRLTASLTERLEADGVPVIVLKGPAIANWLYRDQDVRTYGDADLLVPPDRWDQAIAILRELGFDDGLALLAHPRMESIASYAWVRGEEQIDLHSTIWGAEAPPARTWQVLSAHTVKMNIGGRHLDVLAPGARAMHVALHAAQHGYDDGKPVLDLRLALELLPIELWREAANVAAEINAVGGFATGLRMLPEGQILAAKLGVQRETTVDAVLRHEHVPVAQGFEQLARTPSLRGKLGVLRREFLPTVHFMRWWSPLARRGKVGLVAAYIWRPVYLALHAGPGLIAWRRARRLGQ